jgi:hypothetical protein
MNPEFEKFTEELIADLAGDEIDEGTLKMLTSSLAEPLIAVGLTLGTMAYSKSFMKAVAQSYKNFYDSLVEAGFSPDQAFAIASKVNFWDGGKK